MSNEFCVYLTIYKGNKLPPFYIGHSRTYKVQNRNYHGTVRSKEYRPIWLLELEENPHLFKTVILTFHNTKREALTKERYFQEFHNAHSNPMFINRSIAGEKFYNPNPKPHRREVYQKMSQNMKGPGNHRYGLPKEQHHFYGTKGPMFGKKHSDEAKVVMSLKHSKESNPSFGKMWITDGTNSQYILKTDSIPSGWRKGRPFKARSSASGHHS